MKKKNPNTKTAAATAPLTVSQLNTGLVFGASHVSWYAGRRSAGNAGTLTFERLRKLAVERTALNEASSSPHRRQSVRCASNVFCSVSSIIPNAYRMTLFFPQCLLMVQSTLSCRSCESRNLQ
jgi:hypothetical protein